ncbi:hypothetical protein NL676_006310 [Syzygium grande]|nr:hypothetical protein NL676_006310 [Syzygium grande]
MVAPGPNDFENSTAVAKVALSAATSATATVWWCSQWFGNLSPPSSKTSSSPGSAASSQVFLAAKQSPSVQRMVVSKSSKENHFALAMD